ncbi:tubulin-specific chaperone B, partial [Lecanoromycetidae sp. Uapishka_2]
MASTLTTARDVPLLITSTASSSERRITPSWTIAHLKTKLEPVTGIPSSSQKLILCLPDQQQEIPIEADDEETVEIGKWSLVPYAEIKVTSITPSSNALPPLSSVEKQTMPKEQYETLPDTVLAYKKSHKIGRFDPNAPEILEQKVKAMWKEIEDSKITKGSRCRLNDSRRGAIAFVGPIPSLPGPQGAPWIGVALDEPTGKNDGSVNGERYFRCAKNTGVFVRAEKVEVGEFAELGLDDEDELGSEMEEI